MVKHNERGTFAVPLTSVSWMAVEPEQKKQRGRPKKIESVEHRA